MIPRQPSRKPFTEALVVALALALSSCSSGNSGVHLQTVDPPGSPSASVAQSPTQSTQSSVPSAAPQTTQSAQSVSLSTKASTSATKTTKPPTSSSAPATSTTSPWPANFSPSQQADAKAALAALDGYHTATAAANANPAAKDWTTTIRKYTADPEAAQTLYAVASLKTAKVRETVSPSVDSIKVKSAGAEKVVVQACSDASTVKLVDLAGKPVKFKQLSNPRTMLTYNIYKYDPKYGGWLVSEVVASNPPQKC